MKMRLISKTTLAIMLAMVIFGVEISGQTAPEKPMSKAALSAMISELKGVVKRSERDEKRYEAIVERWDSRKDLAGKPKNKVIDLLYEDVREVIYDPQMLYHLNSIFATYREMPDDAFEPKCEDASKPGAERS